MNASETELQMLWKRLCPIYEHVGLVIESARDGVYRCRVPLNAVTRNHLGTVHAAIQWASAEVLGGIVGTALFDEDDFSKLYGAVKSVSIEFLRPARSDIVAETSFSEAKAEKVRALIEDGENAEMPLDIVVCDEAGEAVATVKALYVIRPLRQG